MLPRPSSNQTEKVRPQNIDTRDSRRPPLSIDSRLNSEWISKSLSSLSGRVCTMHCTASENLTEMFMPMTDDTGRRHLRSQLVVILWFTEITATENWATKKRATGELHIGWMNECQYLYSAIKSEFTFAKKLSKLHLVKLLKVNMKMGRNLKTDQSGADPEILIRGRAPPHWGWDLGMGQCPLPRIFFGFCT